MVRRELEAKRDDMVLLKILGALSIFVGLGFIFGFPDMIRYQHTYHTNVGMILGIFFVLFGIYLIRI